MTISLDHIHEHTLGPCSNIYTTCENDTISYKYNNTVLHPHVFVYLESVVYEIFIIMILCINQKQVKGFM